MRSAATMMALVSVVLTGAAIRAAAQNYSPPPEVRDGGGQRYWPAQRYLSASGDIVPHGEHSGFEEQGAAIAGAGGR